MSNNYQQVNFSPNITTFHQQTKMHAQKNDSKLFLNCLLPGQGLGSAPTEPHSDADGQRSDNRFGGGENTLM